MKVTPGNDMYDEGRGLRQGLDSAKHQNVNFVMSSYFWYPFLPPFPCSLKHLSQFLSYQIGYPVSTSTCCARDFWREEGQYGGLLPSFAPRPTSVNQGPFKAPEQVVATLPTGLEPRLGPAKPQVEWKSSTEACFRDL